MSNSSRTDEPQTKPSEPALELPADFVLVTETRVAGMDRKLGYFGDARFVIFYYEPRGEDIMWKDGQSCGFGSGAWRIFLDEIGPLAMQCGVDIGGGESPGTHVLLIDRERRTSYFVPHPSADHFLAALHGFPSKKLSCLSPRRSP